MSLLFLHVVTIFMLNYMFILCFCNRQNVLMRINIHSINSFVLTQFSFFLLPYETRHLVKRLLREKFSLERNSGAGNVCWRKRLKDGSFFFALQTTFAYSDAAALGVSNQDQGVFPTVLGLY